MNLIYRSCALLLVCLSVISAATSSASDPNFKAEKKNFLDGSPFTLLNANIDPGHESPPVCVWSKSIFKKAKSISKDTAAVSFGLNVFKTIKKDAKIQADIKGCESILVTYSGHQEIVPFCIRDIDDSSVSLSKALADKLGYESGPVTIQLIDPRGASDQKSALVFDKEFDKHCEKMPYPYPCISRGQEIIDEPAELKKSIKVFADFTVTNEKKQECHIIAQVVGFKKQLPSDKNDLGHFFATSSLLTIMKNNGIEPRENTQISYNLFAHDENAPPKDESKLKAFLDIKEILKVQSQLLSDSVRKASELPEPSSLSSPLTSQSFERNLIKEGEKKSTERLHQVSRERTSFEPSSMQEVLPEINSSFEIWKKIQKSVIPKASNDFCRTFLISLLEFASASQIVNFLLAWIENFASELLESFPDLKAAEVLFKAAKYCTEESNIPSTLMFLELMALENKPSSLPAFDSPNSQFFYQSSIGELRSSQPFIPKKNEKSEENLRRTIPVSNEPVFELRDPEIRQDTRFSASQKFPEKKTDRFISKKEESFVPPSMNQEGFRSQNLAHNSTRIEGVKPTTKKGETVITENLSKKVGENISATGTFATRQSVVNSSVSQNKLLTNKPSVSPFKGDQTVKQSQNSKKI